MADIFVDPGLNKIHAAISAANSGDRLILRDGTYTHNGAYCINWLAINKVYNSLTIMAEHEHMAIIDFSGVNVGGPCIQGRNGTESGGLGKSERIIWDGVVFNGGPAGGGEMFDQSNPDRYTGWEFQNVKLGTWTGPHCAFRFLTRPSQSMVFDTITTLPTYNREYVFRFAKGSLAAVPALDLKIVNCDIREHVGGVMISPIFMQNVADVRVGGCRIDGKSIAVPPAFYGIDFEGDSAGLITRDIHIYDCEVNNNGTAAGIIMNAYANGAVIERVKIHNCKTNNSTIGIELDSGPIGSGAIVRNVAVTNAQVANSSQYGIICATYSENCSITNATVVNCQQTAIRFHGGSYNRAEGIRAINCRALAGWSAYAGSDTRRDTIRASVAIDCDYVYEILNTADNSFPTTAVDAHRIGGNLASGTKVAFATVEGVNKTQAQFEALYPNSIEKSDSVVTTLPLGRYSKQEALNRMINPVTPTSYTETEATNVLATMREYGMTMAEALNFLS